MDHGINPNLPRRWVIEQERLGHHELAEIPGVQRDVAANTRFESLSLYQPMST
ncbi:hypothetical protein [Candidimonas nitroreducens]|uniref:hypothetical protein n=1 Tax=Candidimonas nitroreducens TaxID=683354 RepID=UPI0013033DF5|nr:hypothetical protein [Candidimonas nitroreducens]